MSAIVRSGFWLKSLLLIVFILLSFFYHPAPGHCATRQDVQNFLAANPAPAGCNNWTEEIVTDAGTIVKVWRRCAGNAIAYSESWMGGSTSSANAPSCYTYKCDGSGATLSHDFWWTGACIGPSVSAVKMDSVWYVTHYCDGRIETTPAQSADLCTPGIGCTYGASSPCNWNTAGTPDINSPQCRSYDTLLATFTITCDLKITSFTANRTIIDPSIGESVTFSGAMTETSGQSVSWTITLKDGSGATWRTWSGSGTSASVSWDGKDSFGRIADDGNYTAVLEARTGNDECFQAATAQVVVKSSCVVETIDISRDWVAPQNTGAVPEITTAEITVALRSPAPPSGCIFRPDVEPVDLTGGHMHAGGKPTGSLSPEVIIITRGEQEGTPVTYTSGEVAGTEKIKVSLVDSDGTVRSQEELSVDVKMAMLGPLGDGSGWWRLTGQTETHPDNHYGEPYTVETVPAIAIKYFQRTGITLGINDLSLEWGGLFDINANWSTPHITHRKGTSADIDRRVHNVETGEYVLINCEDDDRLAEIVSRFMYSLSVTWTFSRFEINYLERRKTHAKETAQLHPRGESNDPQASPGRAGSSLGPVRSVPPSANGFLPLAETVL